MEKLLQPGSHGAVNGNFWKAVGRFLLWEVSFAEP